MDARSQLKVEKQLEEINEAIKERHLSIRFHYPKKLYKPKSDGYPGDLAGLIALDAEKVRSVREAGKAELAQHEKDSHIFYECLIGTLFSICNEEIITYYQASSSIPHQNKYDPWVTHQEKKKSHFKGIMHNRPTFEDGYSSITKAMVDDFNGCTRESALKDKLFEWLCVLTQSFLKMKCFFIKDEGCVDEAPDDCVQRLLSFALIVDLYCHIEFERVKVALYKAQGCFPDTQDKIEYETYSKILTDAELSESSVMFYNGSARGNLDSFFGKLWQDNREHFAITEEFKNRFLDYVEQCSQAAHRFLPQEQQEDQPTSALANNKGIGDGVVVLVGGAARPLHQQAHVTEQEVDGDYAMNLKSRLAKLQEHYFNGTNGQFSKLNNLVISMKDNKAIPDGCDDSLISYAELLKPILRTPRRVKRERTETEIDRKILNVLDSMSPSSGTVDSQRLVPSDSQVKLDESLKSTSSEALSGGDPEDRREIFMPIVGPRDDEPLDESGRPLPPRTFSPSAEDTDSESSGRKSAESPGQASPVRQPSPSKLSPPALPKTPPSSRAPTPSVGKEKNTAVAANPKKEGSSSSTLTPSSSRSSTPGVNEPLNRGAAVREKGLGKLKLEKLPKRKYLVTGSSIGLGIALVVGVAVLVILLAASHGAAALFIGGAFTVLAVHCGTGVGGAAVILGVALATLPGIGFLSGLTHWWRQSKLVSKIANSVIYHASKMKNSILGGGTPSPGSAVLPKPIEGLDTSRIKEAFKGDVPVATPEKKNETLTLSSVDGSRPTVDTSETKSTTLSSIQTDESQGDASKNNQNQGASPVLPINDTDKSGLNSVLAIHTKSERRLRTPTASKPSTNTSAFFNASDSPLIKAPERARELGGDFERNKELGGAFKPPRHQQRK